MKGSSNFLNGMLSPRQIRGHRYCSSRRDIFLLRHVIKQNHVIKGSGDYNDTSPSS